jgi:hypothetical protein
VISLPALGRPAVSLALILSSGPLLAQIDVSQHAGGSLFASRGGVPVTTSGWAHEGYKFDRQGGGIAGGIEGTSAIVQDADCSTSSPIQFAILGGGASFATGLPSLPPGAPNSWPDVSNQIAVTPLFATPTAGGGACAWIYNISFSTPIDTAPLGDLFVSTFLASNLGTMIDGVYAQCAVSNSGPGRVDREFPLASSDPATFLEQSTEFGLTWLGLGPAQRGAALLPTTKRIWLNRLRYDHTTRSGALDTTGVYTTALGAPTPQNFGMAGSYPDATNLSGLPAATPRRDEMIWADQHAGDFALGTGIGQVLLSTAALRLQPGFTAPLPLPGIGLLELDPRELLFAASGAIPGLNAPISTPNGLQVYLPGIPLAQAPGNIGDLLHLNQVDIYAQVVRLDLATGAASLGSLVAHSFRR